MLWTFTVKIEWRGRTEKMEIRARSSINAIGSAAKKLRQRQRKWGYIGTIQSIGIEDINP